MSEQIYCNKRTDGNKIHELVERIDWDQGLIIYYCMWCNKDFGS